MSPTANLPAAILDTVLNRLALFFLATTAGDLTAARHAAQQMLSAYHPESPEEVSLAAEIVSFSFQALETLSQAVDPDMSLNRKLRLRGSAVSLSREAHKSQRKLDQLQKLRRAAIVAAPLNASTPQPEPVRVGATTAPASLAIGPKEMPRKVPASAQTWSQAYQQRQTARRITENLRKNQLNAPPGIPEPASTQSAGFTSGSALTQLG